MSVDLNLSSAQKRAADLALKPVEQIDISPESLGLDADVFDADFAGWRSKSFQLGNAPCFGLMLVPFDLAETADQTLLEIAFEVSNNADAEDPDDVVWGCPLDRGPYSADDGFSVAGADITQLTIGTGTAEGLALTVSITGWRFCRVVARAADGAAFYNLAAYVLPGTHY